MENPTFHSRDTSLNVDFSFNRDAIARFLLQLSHLDSQNAETLQTLARSCQDLQQNDAQLQSYFTVLLLSMFVGQPQATSTYPHVSVCQPVEDALQEQFAHERLLNQLTNQIRQSLDLSVILASAVNQVRDFLRLDRLIRQYEGTGLGLALTKHLVELHQGQIEVDFVIGGGSMFTVWVPMVRSQK